MILPAEILESFTKQLLCAAGVAEPKAALVANSLVASNLRGVDSHGVQLASFYLEQILDGNVDIHADGRVASENAACLAYDGQNGIGQWISETCCGHANRICREHGAAIVVARESNHFGAAAFWARRMSDAGFIGIVMCNASPLVAPWQGREARFGTNPICMSVPGPKSWLLDMATTTVALGKILNAQFRGQKAIPEGWAVDKLGAPTTSTDAALDGGMPAPLGGYKGSGLAMMAEILCAVLSGGAMSTELGGLRVKGQPMRVSQLFIAIDVARFMPADQFADRMHALVAMVKSSAHASGYGEILVAGDPEWRMEERRRREGIPISDGVWKNLTTAARTLQVPLPK